jgi:PAS domain S-box-containing protein
MPADGVCAPEPFSLGEKQLRQIIDAAPSGMIMVNQSGQIVLVNTQIENLFGYERTDLIGQSIEILVPQASRDKHPDYRNSFFADPHTRAMGVGRDLYGLRKDGTEIPVEIGLNPLVTDGTHFVLASVVDITERKRAEERLRITIEAAPSGMLMVDQQGKIVLVNSQVERLFGYSREELLGQLIEFWCLLVCVLSIPILGPDFSRILMPALWASVGTSTGCGRMAPKCRLRSV